MPNIGIMTGSSGKVPLEIINKQNGYEVTALVFSPYNDERFRRALSMGVWQKGKEGITVREIHRPYSWKRTSLEAYRQHPKLVREYVGEVMDVFERAEVNLVVMRAQDHIMPKLFLKKFPSLNDHPTDPKLHGGPGMHQYAAIEEVLRKKEENTQVTIMRVEPDKKIDEGLIIDRRIVEVPLELHEMFIADQHGAVMKLDEIIDAQLMQMYPYVLKDLSEMMSRH